MKTHQNHAKKCARCAADFNGWPAAKYCSSKCRILTFTVPSQSGCWEWTGKKNRSGYGQLNYNKAVLIASRVSFEAWRGPIEAGLCVCHTCDNRGCVNPDHLFLGTVADNSADMVAKQRHSHGETHAFAKFTENEVRAILTSKAPTKALARSLGVSPRTIHSIRSGRTWRHLERNV